MLLYHPFPPCRGISRLALLRYGWCGTMLLLLMILLLIAAGNHGCHGFRAAFSPTATNNRRRSLVATTRLSGWHPMTPMAFHQAESSPRYMFGGVFGGDDGNKNKEKELALYQGLELSKFDALVDYIQQWAQLFEGEGRKSMGLTTPVMVVSVKGDTDTAGDDDVAVSRGVQILFLKVQTGYADKDEKKEEQKGGGGSQETKKKKKAKEVKQGGVEVLVEKLKNDDSNVQIRARRCEVEEGTMIKEMSEETILKELKKAIDVWKKEH